MKFFIASLLSFASLATFSQPKVFVYYFDAELNPVNKEKAEINGRGIKTQNGVTVDFFATKTGNKIHTTEYSDSTLNNMNGKNIEYHLNGQIKQVSFYNNNVLDGTVEVFNQKGVKTDSLRFKNGALTSSSKFSDIRLDQLLYITKTTDSINNKYYVQFYDTLKVLVSMAIFTGNSGVWNKFDINGNILSSDSVFNRGISTSAYPGGPEAWRRFVESNLKGETPSANGAGKGNYTVIVEFLINEDGSITNLKPLTKLCYGMEDEFIRILKKSGEWIPNKVFGKNVKGVRRQPLTFAVH